jgi:hypothetical protein
MRLLTLVLGSTLAAIASTACGGGASKADCQKLLDKLIDLEMKAGGSDGTLTSEQKEQLEGQRKEIFEYADGQAFVATCTDKTPADVVSCMLDAPDLEAVAACDSKK